jgi:hypothetical protein
MSALADRIGNHPVLLALLDRLDEVQGQQLGAAEAVANQHGEHRVVAQTARCRRCRVIEKPPSLFRREPVPKSSTDSPHRGNPKVDGGRRIPPLLKVNAVAEHNAAVEREPGSEQYQATNSRIAWS